MAGVEAPAAAGDPSPASRPGRATLVLVLILALSLGAFAAARAARSSDDIVNDVVLTPRVPPGKGAAVVFTLTEPDRRADVLIIDESDRQVRALQLGQPLEAGRLHFHWDATADDGTRARPGTYALQVILGEQERDIRPPQRIRVLPTGSGESP